MQAGLEEKGTSCIVAERLPTFQRKVITKQMSEEVATVKCGAIQPFRLDNDFINGHAERCWGAARVHFLFPSGVHVPSINERGCPGLKGIVAGGKSLKGIRAHAHPIRIPHRPN